MSEVILSLILLALLVERYLSQKEMKKEREYLIKAALAKDLPELMAAQPLPVEDELEKREEDLIPIDSNHPEQFDAYIKRQLEGSHG